MSDAPPSYAQATTGDAKPRPADSQSGAQAHTSGIPAQRRRSMEDEMRPLPHGWIRQFDSGSQHQFYVDTNAKPPRSIWHHPYDDQDFLATLPPSERERIEELNANPVSSHPRGAGASTASPAAAAAYGAIPEQAPAKGVKKFGRSLKDKITGTTHEQREQERRERDLQEQREYETHQRIRAAMARAMETGQPQLVGKDTRNGKDVYIEPPQWQNQGYARPGGFYGGGGYGYNPYNSNGPYRQQNPNAVYLRPDYPYQRPYGSGYGGGIGLPLVGGLLGGALLGSLLF